MRERRKVAAQRLRVWIRLALQRRGTRRGLAGQLAVRRRQPRVDPRQGAAIRLVGAGVGGVAAGVGQRGDRIVDLRIIGRDREFGTERVDLREIMAERDFRRAGERGLERIGGDERIAVAVAADPVAGLQEARNARAERAVPALVEHRQCGHETVAQIGKRGVDLVGDLGLARTQRAGLPEESDLAQDRFLDQFAGVGLGAARVTQRQQRGDPVAVVEDRLAPHFGRVRGQHRGHERVLEQLQRRTAIDLPQRGGEIGGGFGGRALTVLGEVREEREEPEPAHESERLVEIHIVDGKRNVAAGPVAFDRRRADRLGPLVQRVAAVGADDVAKQFAEIDDVGIVAERGHHGPNAGAAVCGAQAWLLHNCARAGR